MANLTVNFGQKLNTSLQPGDIVFFLKNDNIQELGECISIASDRLSIVVDVSPTTLRPVIGDYFMFAKNNVINSNGLIGYHANVVMENTNTDFIELYAVNSEAVFSSN